MASTPKARPLLTLFPVTMHTVTGKTPHLQCRQSSKLHMQMAYAVESSKSQNLHRICSFPFPHSHLESHTQRTDICAAASRVTFHRRLICYCKFPTCALAALNATDPGPATSSSLRSIRSVRPYVPPSPFPLLAFLRSRQRRHPE